jgi:ubiquinone/menaquinone biosynthesis C-methylase UbiE
MIKQASQSAIDSKVTLGQTGTEDLSFLPDSAADFVIAGQAVRWVNHARTWPEPSRVVKPGGSLAFWGYKDNVLIGQGLANDILDNFCYKIGEVAPGVEGVNSYWERPDRDIVRKLLRPVTPPEAQ